MTSYYQQPPRPERGTFTYTTTYPQDNISYAYTAAPPTPTSPSYNPSGYYPPTTSSSSTKQHRTSYYPPSSSAAYAPIPPAAPRRRSSSFSSNAAAQAQAPAEVLYRHINGGPPVSSSKPSARSSSKPRRFSKTAAAAADDYEYLYGPGADDKFYVSDDNEEDSYVYGYDKDKLSQRFDRGRSGLRRSTTTTERIERSKTRRLSTAADDYEDGLLTNLGLGIGGLKISSSSKPRERSATRTRGRDGRDTRERSLPRAPRPPAPQRASPPPAPLSSLSTESNRSRRSAHHHHGVSFADDPLVIPIHSREKVREERKEKSWMNINGNKISVDHKGVKINGQRYDAPGGKGVFNVGGIKVRVDGGVISLV